MDLVTQKRGRSVRFTPSEVLNASNPCTFLLFLHLYISCDRLMGLILLNKIILMKESDSDLY